MHFSKRALRLHPSPISEVFDHATKLRAKGVDLADFSVGEPDFDTPVHIRNAGIAAIENGHTRYTAVDGSLELKEAIRRKFLRDQNMEIDHADIVVGSGAKPVLAAAVMCAAGEGDEVLLPTPAWPSHLGMIEMAGAEPVLVEAGFEDGYKINAEKLKARASEKTKLLILTSPSNPTGAVYSKEEFEEIADFLRAHSGISVILDELYEHIVFDGHKALSLSQIAPDLKDRLMVVNGVSKAYAMTGWRIGYGAGSREWARKIAGYFSQMEGSPCAISQKAAIAALDGPQNFLNLWKDVYQKRRDLLLKYIGQCEALDVLIPMGSFYVFVDIQKIIGAKKPNGDVIEDDRDFARYLLDYGVVVTPGSAFMSPGSMRISIATSDQEIKKGGERIVKALKALRF